MATQEVDYARANKTIQQAMVDHAKRHPSKQSRPTTIRWDQYRIQTFDIIQVARTGRVRLEFLSRSQGVRQGVDLKVDGWFVLAQGERVPLLRTWQDEMFEDVVEYPYVSKDGYLRTWNVYEMTYSGGQQVEEKWTENAGFWVETISDTVRVYHCSHGMAAPPDFNSLVYKLTIEQT